MSKKERVLAANKAVCTLRLNKLCKANLNEIKLITEQIFEAESEFEYDYSVQGIISKEILKTTWQSFCRYGDRNRATKGMILTWIDNRALTLDSQAAAMTNEFDKEVEPDMLAEFMIAYDCGINEYPQIEKMNRLKSLFKTHAGFNFDRAFALQHILKKDISITGLAPF